MNRLRTNVAWILRGIAKRINARAERLDPIKLSRPAITVPTSSRAFLTSKSQAEQIIEKARAH